jgi:predicted chitinase
MPVKFNTNNVISLYYGNGGITAFPQSLKDTLNFLQNDDKISNVKELSYFLATAKAESDYSLQRWESDFLCGSKGVPYDIQPCQKAIDYYRSSSGKKNYFDLGVDSRGIPYFGRGLIQLTGKGNYQKYGQLAGLGDTLVQNGDLALVPKNSYKIASAYMNARTFKYVNKDDLTRARKSVNGGTKGVARTNESYYRWLNVFKNPNAKFEVLFWTKKKRILFAILSFGLLSTGFFLIYKGVKNEI